MPCLLAFLAWVSPRLVLLLLAIFSDYLGRAYGNWFLPFLGFFFMPLTTLAAAYAINAGGGLHGLYLALVIVAALYDLGLLGGGARRWHRRRTDGRVGVRVVRREFREE